MRLTERDLIVFKEFLNLGPLIAKHLVTLGIFPNQKKSRDRLRLLHQKGYVDCCSKPYFGRGRPEYVYYLNQRKANEILLLLDCSREDICIMKPSAYAPLLLHHLAINDFVICIRQACKHSGVYEASIIPEYKQLSSKVSKLKKSTAQSFITTELIPDGLICLSRKKDATKSLLFFEIYRATQTLEGGERSIRHKLEDYIAYRKQGLYSNFSDLFSHSFKGFRVLLVVYSVSYLEKLKNICNEIAPAGLFWLALNEDITPTTVFKPIWHVSGEEGLEAIVNLKERGE